jgi:hypothetical protein
MGSRFPARLGSCLTRTITRLLAGLFAQLAAQFSPLLGAEASLLGRPGLILITPGLFMHDVAAQIGPLIQRHGSTLLRLRGLAPGGAADLQKDEQGQRPEDEASRSLVED